MLLRTVLELAAVVLIIYGLINEERLIRWEDKMMRFFRIKIKNGIKKQQLVGKQATVKQEKHSAQRVNQARNQFSTRFNSL